MFRLGELKEKYAQFDWRSIFVGDPGITKADKIILPVAFILAGLFGFMGKYYWGG